jgi:DNA-binding Lrp family transcriptional regulator
MVSIVPIQGADLSVTAYILIQASVGTAVDVAQAAGELAEIVSAEVAMGPYDVIARAQAGSMDDLGQIVVHAVQSISGVERTLLCPIVNV